MEAARRGFSMIEVLMAVVIASLAGMALLESSAQGRRAYETALAHQNTAEAVALVALSSHAMGGVGQNDAATLLGSRYPINNSRINEKLKKHYFILKTERSNRWDGSTEGNATQKAIAAISKNAIEKTIIETNGVTTSLYGLSGEGW